MSYTWSLTKAFDRDRRRGEVEACVDWDSGERVPMSKRQPAKWATLPARVQAGYSDQWRRKVAEATPKPFCDIHARTLPCPTCWRIERDRLNASVEADAKAAW